MDEVRYEDSADILSAQSDSKKSIKEQRRNLIRGIFYCLVCAVCLYLLTK